MHRKAFKPKTMHTHVTQRPADSGSGISSLCAASGDNICVTLVSRQSPASVFILKKEAYVDAKGEKGEELNSNLLRTKKSDSLHHQSLWSIRALIPLNPLLQTYLPVYASSFPCKALPINSNENFKQAFQSKSPTLGGRVT